MTEDRYEPRYQWKRTQLDENDPPTDFDWIGMDGAAYIGRIRKELSGPTKGLWQWSGAHPRSYKGSPPTPNQGYRDTARQATQMVEEYWDLAMRVMEPR